MSCDRIEREIARLGRGISFAHDAFPGKCGINRCCAEVGTKKALTPVGAARVPADGVMSRGSCSFKVVLRSAWPVALGGRFTCRCLLASDSTL
jgi:hypothetical protein